MLCTSSLHLSNIKMATVLVVGCGIVGPVIALLLKKKGYRPVIAERVTEMRDVGLSHSLYPNGYV